MCVGVVVPCVPEVIWKFGFFWNSNFTDVKCLSDCAIPSF